MMHLLGAAVFLPASHGDGSALLSDTLFYSQHRPAFISVAHIVAAHGNIVFCMERLLLEEGCNGLLRHTKVFFLHKPSPALLNDLRKYHWSSCKGQIVIKVHHLFVQLRPQLLAIIQLSRTCIKHSSIRH